VDLISKDELLQVQCPIDDVELHHPDGRPLGRMRVRGLTGAEVNEWQDAVVEVTGKKRRQSKHTMAMLIVASAINPDGTPYFEPREVLRVSQMPGFILTQLVEPALRMSGLSEADVEELVEGFDDGPSEDATSG
jgi:hypothetical protein